LEISQGSNSNLYLGSFNDGIRADRDIDLLEWADTYFYLPRESSAEHGKYRSLRTPMVREILLELSPNSKTEEVVVQKPTQLAGTTAAIIFLTGTADIAPGPSLCIQPTEALATSFSKKKIDPTVRSVIANSGRLKDKIKDQKSRDSNNTILEKTFPGGSWRFAGSNSPAVYRSESVRYIILDDYDGFDPNVGGEGDPGELADRRTGTFKNRKIYKNSTPTMR
jgi:phage terminase large subunit GpA-like protein